MNAPTLAQLVRAKAASAAGGASAPKLRALGLPVLLTLVASPSGLVPALFWLFLKTGFLVFGSGLVVVSFVKTYVVDQYRWLDVRVGGEVRRAGRASIHLLPRQGKRIDGLIAGTAGVKAPDSSRVYAEFQKR